MDRSLIPEDKDVRDCKDLLDNLTLSDLNSVDNDVCGTSSTFQHLMELDTNCNRQLTSPVPLYTWSIDSLPSCSSLDDFSSNGVESPLNAFDMYQCRLRETTATKRSFKSTVCVFCKNNGEKLSVYGSHSLKDESGRVVCPILQRYVCPVCGASGHEAHTLKYCPYNYTYKIHRVNKFTMPKCKRSGQRLRNNTKQ